MSSIKIFKIKPEQVVGCNNFTVEFIHDYPSCVNRPCEINSSNEFEIHIDEDCNEEVCIQGFYKCDDDCASCPSKAFKYCLCTPSTVLSNCQECVDGIITEICSAEELAQGKVCGSGLCGCPVDKPFYSPTLEKCVVCEEGSVNSQNKCLECKNGQWVDKDCADATCSQLTGDCIPNCVENGKYNVDTKECECVSGFMMDSTGACVPEDECNPDDTDIPPCKVCINGFLEDIVCADPNKICVDDECVNPPCTGDCENGFDCAGENCGCLDGKCADCAENPSALGCAPNPCSGSCSDGQDCAGDDCGCFQGECVPCSFFNCNPDLCGVIDGCGCNGTKCEGNGESSCNDDLKLEVKDCVLEAELSLSKKCQCEALSSGLYVDSISTANNVTTASFKADIRKGISNSAAQHAALPLFSNVDINNELPIAGKATLTVTATYKDVLTGSKSTEVAYQDVKSFAQKSELDFSNVVIGTTEVGVRIFIGYSLKLEVKELDFESGCFYIPSIYNSNSMNLTDEGFVESSTVKSKSSKNPLMTWTQGSVFRSFYIQADADGKYRDVLYGPKKFISDLDRGVQNIAPDEKGEFISKKDYKVSVDCGCDKLEVIEQVVVCDIEFEKDVQAIYSECNTRLSLDNQFSVCPINRNLKDYGYGNNHESQTKYLLKVNGSLEATFVYDNASNELRDESTNVKWDSWSASFPSGVESVSLELNHDSSCKKEHTVEILLNSPTFESICNTDGTVTYKVSNTSDLSVDYVEVLNSITRTKYYFSNSTFILIDSLQKGTNNFLVSYKNGCEKSVTETDNCCETGASVTINQTIKGLIAGSTALIDFTLEGFVGTPTVLVSNGTTVSGNQFTAGIGVTTLTVTDSTGCSKTAKITLVEINDNSSLVFDINPQCIGDVSELAVTSEPNTYIEVKDPNNNTLSGTTNSAGEITFSGLSTSGTYTLTMVGTSSVLNPVNLVIVDSVELTAMNLATTNTYCTSNAVQVDLEGTENSTITLIAAGAGGDLTVDLDANGNGVALLTYASAGNYNIAADSGSVGLCSTPLSGDLDITIVDGPTIVDVTFDCLPPLVGNSDVTVNVSSQSGLTVTAVVDGVTYAIPATGATNIYSATIPQGSGKNIEVIATSASGTCADTENLIMPNCDCVTPSNPTFNTLDGDGIEYLCGGTVDLNVYNNAANATIKWYSDSALTNLLGTGLTYTASVGGTYYVVAEDNTTQCQSNSVLFSVIEGDYVLSMTVFDEVCLNAVNQSITANVAGNSNGMIFRFEIDGSVVQNGTSNVLLYDALSLGTKAISVISKRADGSCEKTVSDSFDVVSCCTNISISVNGATNVSCEDLTATVNGGQAPFTYAWTGTGDLGTVVNESGDTFDNTLITAGEFVELTLTVTDNDGCTDSVLVDYNKCSCLCNEADSCVQELTSTNSQDGYGTIVTTDTLPAGKELEFELINNNAADRLAVYENGVLLVDTTYAGTFGFDCATNNGYSSLDLLPYVDGDDVTSVINALADGFVKSGITVTVKKVAVNSPRSLTFNYTLPADTVITVEHNNSECTEQGGFGVVINCAAS